MSGVQREENPLDERLLGQAGSLSTSHTDDDFFLGKACLGSASVFVLRAAETEGTGDLGSIAAVFQSKDLIVACGGNPLERATIDSRDGGTGHELAESDVELTGVPMQHVVGAHGTGELFDHPLQGSECLGADVLRFRKALDPRMDVNGGDGFFHSANNQMGCIGNLWLVP